MDNGFILKNETNYEYIQGFSFEKHISDNKLFSNFVAVM